MKENHVISRLIAGFFLALFLVGSAPKTYFHDLVADHRDFSSCDEDHTTTVLHNEDRHCHFDDLVVNSPFIQPVLDVSLPAIPYAPSRAETILAFLFCSNVQSCDSRGPPAA